MRFPTGLSLLVAVCAVLCAGPPTLAESALRLDAGYRVGDFDWNIAGDVSEGPDVLSELSYNDLQVFQLRVEGDVTLKGRFVSRLGITFGEILNGESRDSDFGGDGRTL